MRLAIRASHGLARENHALSETPAASNKTVKIPDPAEITGDRSDITRCKAQIKAKLSISGQNFPDNASHRASLLQAFSDAAQQLLPYFNNGLVNSLSLSIFLLAVLFSFVSCVLLRMRAKGKEGCVYKVVKENKNTNGKDELGAQGKTIWSLASTKEGQLPYMYLHMGAIQAMGLSTMWR